MKISNAIKEYQSINNAVVQLVKVEERLDREGNQLLKDGLPKYRVEAVLKQSDGSLSVGTFTATHTAGQKLSKASTMSKWKIEQLDGWLYSSNDNVRASFSVQEVSAVPGAKSDEG